MEYLAIRGIVSGYPNTYDFGPNNPTLRGQFTKMLVLALGQTPCNDCPQHFPDVPPGSIYFGFVERAYALGWVSGYPNGNFHPEYSTTRGQIAKMVVTAKGWPLLNPQTPTFVDVPPGSTYYQYIETGYAHGVLAGYQDGTYRPNNISTRAQSSKVLYFAVQQP